MIVQIFCKIGKWGIGLATSKVNLDKIPLGNDTESWVLRDSGSIFFNNVAKFNTNRQIDDGDIIVLRLVFFECYNTQLLVFNIYL